MTSRVEPTPPRRFSDVSDALSRRRSPATRAGSLLGRTGSALLLALAAGCGSVDRFPQTSLDPRSDFAEMIDGLWNLTLVLGVGVAVIVFAILAYILVRFRHVPGAPPPEQVHGNTRLELAWTLIPAVLIAIIAVPTVRVIFATQARGAGERDPDRRLRLAVVVGVPLSARQRRHRRHGQRDPRPRRPAGRAAHDLARRDPLLLGPADGREARRDPEPGEPHRLHALRAGRLPGQCAEFCGESHALMKMRLIAHPPEQFERWLANEARPAVEPVDSAIVLGSSSSPAAPAPAATSSAAPTRSSPAPART
jgi:cytochrome c oxidase subunit II